MSLYKAQIQIDNTTHLHIDDKPYICHVSTAIVSIYPQTS